MTRRGACTALAAIVGAMTNQVEPVAQGAAISSFVGVGPTQIMFDLRAFKGYTFTLDGESVTLTPDELFADIKPKDGL